MVVAAALLTAIALQAGCAGLASMAADRVRAQAFRIARSAGMESSIIEAGGFGVQAFHRGLAGATSAIVYIEGDGQAWDAPHRPSRDPTPEDPIALRLAALDRSAAVLYLARPCQYQPRAALAACPREYWTSGRYSGKIVAAMDHAIDAVLQQGGARGTRVPLGLVGYSGGGAVAMLLAARRSQVQWVVTLAGNLDHSAWTSAHKVTPLTNSLNAADAAPSLRALPQVHVIGGRDRVVPRSVTEAYLQRSGAGAAIEVIELPDFDHRCCWTLHWPDQVCAALKAHGATVTPCG
ncbi:MAG: hypothetical protein NFCOHLIN_03253 [Gammaproteobacteria bacterium]|nr:hypothetical protein [Gammaproteobacteria bacterium]